MGSMRGKIHLTIIFAFLVGVLFVYYLKETKEQTTHRLTLLSEITELERHQKTLQGELLRSGFFLYHNYDRLHTALGRLRTTLENIDDLYNRVGGGNDTPLATARQRYRQQLARQERLVNRFLTANSLLKNSAMYIPLLSRRLMLHEQETTGTYHTLLADLTSNLYLARNSLDPDLLPAFHASLAALAEYQPPAAIATRHQALLAHGRVFSETLPRYDRLLQAGLEPTADRLIEDMMKALQNENRSWLGRLNLLTYLFFAAFLVSVALIIVLLLRAERENKTLNRLSGDLKTAATTDRLTGLANRFSFDSDQERLLSPLLLLCNIDDFRHINDLYGTAAGDFVLQRIAELLNNNLPAAAPADSGGAQCYRLGGDDFGILLEDSPETDPEQLSRHLLQVLDEQDFVYHEQPLRVSISIGISRQRPLLETADLALKEIKKHYRLRYLLYSDELQLQERIAANLETLQLMRRALANDDILVYYQPIIDNRDGRISKYEGLVRLRDEDGNILSPGSFLEVVKESALYPELTKRVVKRSFADMANCANGFSLNLAVADILDTEVRDYILQMLATYPATARRLTFEILENEGMENVEAVQAFIDEVKAAGCQIAVDDFGSGYSNFAHILTLKVDILKIDATLIRNIDDDPQARVLVHTIVDFCRKLGIKTVAEFVHSAPVYETVKELEIDYSQGFYLGKPHPNPLPDCQ